MSLLTRVPLHCTAKFSYTAVADYNLHHNMHPIPHPTDFAYHNCTDSNHKTADWSLFRSSCHTHTHTHHFNGPFSGTTWVSWHQKGKINLDFIEARDSEWQWHQLGHMQVCTSLQTDNHASTPPLSFYRPDSLPAAQLKAQSITTIKIATTDCIFHDINFCIGKSTRCTVAPEGHKTR